MTVWLKEEIKDRLELLGTTKYLDLIEVRKLQLRSERS